MRGAQPDRNPGSLWVTPIGSVWLTLDNRHGGCFGQRTIALDKEGTRGIKGRHLSVSPSAEEGPGPGGRKSWKRKAL